MINNNLATQRPGQKSVKELVEACKSHAYANLSGGEEKIFTISFHTDSVRFKANRLYLKSTPNGNYYYVSINWIKVNGELIAETV